MGHELLDAAEARSQHPVNHRSFYSLGRAQEGVGTRFLAGTHSLFPSEPVLSFTESSMQLAESTWAKKSLEVKQERVQARSGEDSPSACSRAAPLTPIPAYMPWRFLFLG